MRSLARIACAALIVAATALSLPASAVADRTITLTFVRHAESAGNAAGVTDTTVPGPVITGQGVLQALELANQLSRNGYDGIYASTMVRTQQTAAPMSMALGEPVTVLAGLREIEAGQCEGQPQTEAQRCLSTAQTWLQGDRDARIPGSIDGNEFDARFDDAVQTIYDTGEVNPVAFSHAAAIMVWVLMNVRNPDVSLAANHPLPNTGHVVVVGSPRDGWTLLDWDGTPVSG